MLVLRRNDKERSWKDMSNREIVEFSWKMMKEKRINKRG